MRGSSSTQRIVKPPARSRAWKRVRGTGAISRSSTWTPAAFSPDAKARFRVRDAREASRLAATIAPFLSVEPYAMARRTASSGVTSTFTSPRTPRRPKRVRAALVSQTTEEFTMAPDSTVLDG